MTEIDKAKAVLAVCANFGIALSGSDRAQIANSLRAMIAKAEQADEFEAYKRQVSDAVELVIDDCGHDGFHKVYIQQNLSRFILPKPDKQLRSIAADRLVYAASEYFCNRKNNLELIDAIVELAASAALAKQGLEITRTNKEQN